MVIRVISSCNDFKEGDHLHFVTEISELAKPSLMEGQGFGCIWLDGKGCFGGQVCKFEDGTLSGCALKCIMKLQVAARHAETLNKDSDHDLSSSCQKVAIKGCASVD